MNKKTVYLAASFAYPDKNLAKQRLTYIAKAAKLLRDKGLSVFVPSEHKLPNDWDLTNHDWGVAVYGMDIDALESSDVVVALSYGKRNNNDGMLWECGYAYGRSKKVILVSLSDETESLMLTSSSYAHLSSLNELDGYDFETMPQIHTASNEVS